MVICNPNSFVIRSRREFFSAYPSCICRVLSPMSKFRDDQDKAMRLRAYYLKELKLIAAKTGWDMDKCEQSETADSKRRSKGTKRGSGEHRLRVLRLPRIISFLLTTKAQFTADYVKIDNIGSFHCSNAEGFRACLNVPNGYEWLITGGVGTLTSRVWRAVDGNLPARL
jgi:hypothetical protein